MLASRYQLVHLIGRGGMAELYDANDDRLGRRVAVKVFRGETDIATSQARQQLEIRALARLQHPNIVAIFDAGTDVTPSTESSDDGGDDGQSSKSKDRGNGDQGGGKHKGKNKPGKG
jgi:serine/threonine protein kinase